MLVSYVVDIDLSSGPKLFQLTQVLNALGLRSSSFSDVIYQRSGSHGDDRDKLLVAGVCTILIATGGIIITKLTDGIFLVQTRILTFSSFRVSRNTSTFSRSDLSTCILSFQPKCAYSCDAFL